MARRQVKPAPYGRNREEESKKLPAVYATVIYHAASGESVKTAVRLWSILPAWWATAKEDQRKLWVDEYFRRRVPEGSTIDSVTVNIPQ